MGKVLENKLVEKLDSLRVDEKGWRLVVYSDC